ncbi:unnamed protein product [Amaranthus hypochondriacus]
MVVGIKSDLPWLIYYKINHIFHQKSVLARAWRYRWLLLFDFYPDACNICRFVDSRNIKWDITDSIINKYLLHHTSQNISLCASHYSNMYSWVECSYLRYKP